MSRLFRSAVLAACAVMFAAPSVLAAGIAPVAQLVNPPSKADILGIHTGTPTDQALKLLKAYDPKIQIAPFTGSFELKPDMKITALYDASEKLLSNGRLDPSAHERFLLLSTPAPSKAYVFGIARWVDYQSDLSKAPLAASFVESIKKKYGTPTYEDKSASYDSMSWFADADGKPHPMAKNSLCGLDMDISGDNRFEDPNTYSSMISIGYQTWRSTGDPNGYARALASPACGYATRLLAFVAMDDQGRVQRVQMSLVNFRLGISGFEATRNVLNAIQDAKDAQTKKNAAKQSGPQL